MNDLVETTRNILRNHFQPPDWIITRPEDGQQKASFVAHRGQERLFVKLNMPSDALPALERLGEIKAAPRVVAGGTIDGVSYVVYEYVEGAYPDRRWFAGHLPALATFVKRYHSDNGLLSLLARNAVATSFTEHVERDLAKLEEQWKSLHSEDLHATAIASAFESLRVWSKQLHPVPLVPVHPDPNTKNILLAGGELLMVDWDEVQLSDPARDSGLLLWWYVAQHRWGEFFQSYGFNIDDRLIERIYWWAARSSFAIALWHAEHGFDCRAFLEDFLAAMNKESNPHAVFQAAKEA